ncbi:MAG: hypothetical protein ACSHWZ_01315 [Sulfitobacter sp.]|jgi:hypothetical protein
MSKIELTPTKLRQGIWEGVITHGGTEEPVISVTYLASEVPDVMLEQGDAVGEWLLRVPIPAEAVADGVQTLLITDGASGERLGQITLIAGEGLGDDLRAEVDLLRAELDMLKRAFRRHCLETR